MKVACAHDRIGVRHANYLDTIIAVGAIHLGLAAALVWSGPRITLQGGPSRDGQFFSYADGPSGTLVIRNVKSGEDRVIVRRPAGTRELAYFSTISPDSSQIAYAWRNSEGYYEIRAVSLDGSGERTIFKNEEVRFVQPCAWTPDGKQILALSFRTDNISQIVLLPAAGGAPKILRSLQWVYPKRMDVSPDGRFVVYDSFAPGSTSERTLYSLSIDGSSEKRLVNSPGDHLFPLWTPDGKHIVYLREEGGEMNAWMLPLGGGDAFVVRRNVGRALPLGITADGTYYYGQRNDQSDIYTRDGRAWRTRFPGRNHSPAWDPLGKTLAYLSRRGAENFGVSASAIVVGDRELSLPLPVIEGVRWSPRGDALLVSGMDGKGRAGLFHVDLANGDALRPIAAEAGTALRGFPGVFSKDGQTVYYIYNESEVRAHPHERTIATGSQLRNLAISPDGATLGFTRESTIVLQPLGSGPARTIAFDGVRDLEWAESGIWAARDEELWRVPIDGGAPVRVDSIPRGRLPGFSVGPHDALAITTGSQNTEVWTLSLPQTLAVPSGLDAFVPVPASNPLTREKVELGKRLFFDQRLSLDNTVSCASCHDPKLAFTDTRKTAVGIMGRTGDRRSPRIVNRAYGKTFFWDGRAATLEDQVLQPISNPKEMDLALETAAQRVGLNVNAMRDALASYVRTIMSGDSPYDRYLAGDAAALTTQQRAGLRLFRGKAGCTSCHLGPNLTDEKRHDTGIGGGAFKTPTLREAARTPPYMHDGSLGTLDDVIEFYDKGGKESATLDADIHPLKLSPEEKAALRSFLEALIGTVRDGL